MTTLRKVLILLAFGAVGIALITQTWGDREMRSLLGLGALFLLISLVGIANHIRVKIAAPPRITLSSEGILYEFLRRRQLWLWDEVSGFRKVRFRGADWVGFDVARPGAINPLRDATGADFALLSTRVIDDNTDELVALFNQARARWKSAEAPENVKTAAPAMPARRLLRRLWDGRIARSEYLVGTALCVALGAATIIALVEIPVSPDLRASHWFSFMTPASLILILMGWVFLIQGRFRDAGWSPVVILPLAMLTGSAAFLSVLATRPAPWLGDAALAAVWLIAALGVSLIPSSPNPNRHGPPLPARG
jgi:uncharacterized membrane protein YhaH (DUF805 family)